MQSVCLYNPGKGNRGKVRRSAGISPTATRASTNIFLDAGIRDLFNFAVSTNQIAGLIQGTGANLRVYEDFWRVQDIEEDDRYDFSLVDYAALGENVYVRYGNIDASHEDVCFGDGKHVGTIPQIANRLLTMLGYITARFPNPDRTIVRAPFPISSGTFQVPAPTGGGTMRYSISFPPGYELTQCTDGRDNDGDGLKDGADPDCLHGADLTEGPGDFTRCNDGIDNDADGARDERDEDCLNGDGTSEWPPDSPHRTARYPVIYVMHGYGMAPDELQITALPFSGFMASGLWPKALVIFPDGECGEDRTFAVTSNLLLRKPQRARRKPLPSRGAVNVKTARATASAKSKCSFSPTSLCSAKHARASATIAKP